MANHQSALKRHRQSQQRRLTNQINRHKLKTQMKKLRAALATGKAADAKTLLPATCSVISVSPLLRALILRAVELPLLYDEAGPDGRVMALILDEIRAVPALPLHLPWPVDARLARLCAAIQDDPASERSLTEWALTVGASSRTLARLFRRETGMSFGAWRQQVRLVEALGRLATGQPVTTVALDLGYQSPSAFTSMFRRALGCAPTRYFAAG